MLSDVIGSRSNAQADYFLLKRTELAPYLSIKNVPNSSATLGGWVYVQDNHRKKWNKRWVELRDNCLYLAKTEKGKDEILLCSLSFFDLYLIDTGRVKTPKQHSFALRSQTYINLFESPEADYVHYFSLSDGGAARHWITAIINARTFVLRQEKSHLFRSGSTVGQSVPSAAASAALYSPAGMPQNGMEQMTTRRQRAPLESSSPSLNTAAGGGQGTSPMLSFAQTTYPKGSLMEERFTRPEVGGMTTQRDSNVAERMRREEIQNAERKGRKEGKPLIGIISDVQTAGNSSRP